MGRAQVRTAVQTYLQQAALPYLGTVYPARPTILQEQDYVQTMQGQATQESANGSACVMVVNITRDDRTREMSQGRGAVVDINKHLVVLELFFASSLGTAVKAQEDYDTLADSLIDAIRAQPIPGGSGVVWSAGEFRYGVRHTQSVPYSTPTGLTVHITGVVRFEAWEWVQGTVTPA